MKIYDFTVKDAQMNEVALADYKGKVLLVVNTATGCGFTPQYEGLQDLYEKYQSAGFEILDFPCNQFAFQAPGSEERIVDFCQSRYGVTFKQFAKIRVNGSKQEPLYKYLKTEKEGSIKWNFTKFLIDREGNVIERYSPKTKPEQIENQIKELLK